MADEKVTKLADDTYEQIREKAEREGVTMAEATKRLIEQGGKPPTTCELSQFKRVLEARGLTPPRRVDWLWGVTDVLPPDILAGSKLEPYAQARHEAELRCTLGDQFFDRLIEEKGSVEAVEEVVTKPAGEPTEQAEPVAGLETTEASKAESTEPPEATEPDQTAENV